jgi:hypothetical protein
MPETVLSKMHASPLSRTHEGRLQSCRASFDKLRMRRFPWWPLEDAIPVAPHPELVDGRTLRMQRYAKENPAKRVSAKQDGGPGRTRTCDNTVMSGAF